ncbi:MAG: MXAN_6640 family putative metalloprotease [Chloroflexota bacterium]
MLKKWLLPLALLVVFGVSQAVPGNAQEPITYPGNINDTVEEQEFTVSLKENNGAVITAIAQNGDLDTVLEVFSPRGELVASNDDGFPGSTDSRVAFMAHEDGLYQVHVTRFDTSTSGSYTLEITVGDVSLLDYAVDLTGTALTRDSEHFRYHYTLSGADAVQMDFLDAIEVAFEFSWRSEVEKLGWPAPPTDDAMGGNSLYDVYVINLIGTADDALGFTSPEMFVHDNPNTPEEESYAATSYIAIDNDFNDLEFGENQDEVSVMRATAVHEFHHAIQFGFDGAEPHSWLAEASAAWMETVAAGKDQDGTGYVETAFEYPELCFGTTAEDSSIMYGEWPFLQFLTDEFGDDAVYKLWQAIADYEGFEALNHLLESYGTDVPHEVARYRLNNLARNYRLAPLFHATVWLENTITGTGVWTYGDNGNGVQEMGANYFDFDARAGVYDLELTGDDKKLELWAIGLTEDGMDAIDLGRGGGIDNRNYERMYLMVFNPVYDNNVDECEYTDYQIEVANGKGTTNPVDHVISRTYFEPLD